MNRRDSLIRTILINSLSGIQILLIASFLNFTEAQTISKKYYDSDWRVVDSESEATYYRLYTSRSEEDSTITAEDYYITGELQWKGKFLHLDPSDSKNDIQHGRHEWFLKNGTKIRSAGYSNGQILNDMTYDSTTGLKKNYSVYFDGKLSHEYYYNDDGILETEYNYKQEFQKHYYENGNLKLYAQMKGENIHGHLREYYENGQLSRSRIFTNGELSPWMIQCDEFGTCEEVFSEFFQSDKNDNDWPLNPISDKDNVYIEAGLGLVMDINNGRTYHGELINIPVDQNNDFSIEAVLKPKGNEEGIYGIEWGHYDSRNYFIFKVSTDGYFSVIGYKNGIEIVLVEWEKSSALNIGDESNFLKISKLNEKYFFSINSRLVATSDYWFFRGNNSGVFVSTNERSFELITERFNVYKDYVQVEKDTDTKPKTDWRSNGTGFFVSKKGYIATNYHVVESAEKIEVSFTINDQSYDFPANIEKFDRVNDLAILKIETNNFELIESIPFSISAATSKIGNKVFTLGFPMALSHMGEEIKYTDGSINSLSGYKGDIRTYQVSVPIQPGNSGGPLFDSEGNIIGIITSGLSKDLTDNVGYAFKSSYLINLIELLPIDLNGQRQSVLKNLEREELIKKLSNYTVLIKTS